MGFICNRNQKDVCNKTLSTATREILLKVFVKIPKINVDARTIIFR